MWSQGEVDFFCRRPLDPDYREYCIKDVLDLPEVYQKFKQQVAPETLQMCEWLSSSYVRQGYQNSKELEQQQWWIKDEAMREQMIEERID